MGPAALQVDTIEYACIFTDEEFDAKSVALVTTQLMRSRAKTQAPPPPMLTQQGHLVRLQTTGARAEIL
jgi:hypothetical protein